MVENIIFQLFIFIYWGPITNFWTSPNWHIGKGQHEFSDTNDILKMTAFLWRKWLVPQVLVIGMKQTTSRTLGFGAEPPNLFSSRATPGTNIPDSRPLRGRMLTCAKLLCQSHSGDWDPIITPDGFRLFPPFSITWVAGFPGKKRELFFLFCRWFTIDGWLKIRWH